MTSNHDDSASVSHDAFRWLLGAGGFAVALSLFLAITDYRLSHSTSEKDLGNTLLELRSAQASLPSRVTDDRQLLNVQAERKTAEPAIHGHSSGEGGH